MQTTNKGKLKTHALPPSKGVIREPNKLLQANIFKTFRELLQKGTSPRAVREKMLNARIPLKEIDQFFVGTQHLEITKKKYPQLAWKQT